MPGLQVGIRDKKFERIREIIMFLFFSEFGIPASFAFFLILGLLICPVFSVMGIFYIYHREYNASTVLISLAAFLLLSACSFPFVNSLADNDTLRDVSYYLFYLSYPFGFTATMLLAAFQHSLFGINDSRFLPAVCGILVNLLSIFGMVRFTQRFIEKRLK
jgi:hypothetical protein